MSHAVRKVDTAGSSLALPTTAPVVEFICLFSHDLRRKQKRWQDGRLKYHTFNKRVMVYDDGGKFIGDTHWQVDGDVADGQELQLDRGAAIVQVAEAVGMQEQDLGDLLDKRARDVERRRAQAAKKRTVPAQGPRVPSTIRNRPLSSVVASPGPLGRAVIPDHSPYEARQAAQRLDGAEANPMRPTKKRQACPSPPLKASYAQSLFGTRLNLSSGRTQNSSVRHRPWGDGTNTGSRESETTSWSMRRLASMVPEQQGRDPEAAWLRSNERQTSERTCETREHRDARRTAMTFSTVGVPQTGQDRLETIARSPTPAKTLSPVHRSPRRGDSRRMQSATNYVMSEVHASPLSANCITETSVKEITPSSKKPAASIHVPHGDPHPASCKEVKAMHAIDDTSADTSGSSRDPSSILRDPLGKRSTESARNRLMWSSDEGAPSPQVVPFSRLARERRTGTPCQSGAVRAGWDAETQAAQSGDGAMPDPLKRRTLTHRARRAELHIRPRRKRGLLTMSEKIGHETGNGTAQTGVSATGIAAKSAGKSGNCTHSSNSDVMASGILDAATSRTDTAQGRARDSISKSRQMGSKRKNADGPATEASRRRPSRSPSRAFLSSDDDDAAALESSDSDNTIPLSGRRTRDEEITAAREEAATNAPRICRMARRSVKSKEVFGFVPLGNTDRLSAATAARADSPGTEERIGATPAAVMQGKIQREQAAPAGQTNGLLEGENRHKLSASVAVVQAGSDGRVPAPRLTNPASRGRKAATKEDAAGQVPQSVLPKESDTTVVTTSTASAMVVVPRKACLLPGFSRAGGGAWSREADDLLGMSRPRSKPSQR